MSTGRSTYRIQFRAEFGFDDAAAVVPYLSSLGITHLYSSPIFRARRGSTHGYDVVDPTMLNEELGGEEAFRRLTGALREHGMGLVLDVVPNHMAASPENPWWMDLLEYGPASAHANFFDIDWTHLPGDQRAMRILLPILGRPYGEALEGGEIRIEFDGSGLQVVYWDHRLPVAPDSWSLILQRVLDHPEAAEKSWRVQADQLSSEIWRARSGEPGASAQRRRWKHALLDLVSRESSFKEVIGAVVEELNGRKGHAESFDELDRLLEDQWYRLAYWRTAGEAINYRRFFDVTDLVGVRVEEPAVFEARHAHLFGLIAAGDVNGLRIDHIDGLYDPAGYLGRLQEKFPGMYVVVEKILGRGERLPPDLPCAGTTGYDFLAAVNELFVDARGLDQLREVWIEFSRDERDFDEVVRQSKIEVISSLFPGEMRALAQELATLAAGDRDARDFLPGEIEEALTELTAALDVYRTYTTAGGVSDSDREVVRRATERARALAAGSLDRRIFDFISRVLLLEPPRYLQHRREEWAAFLMRWQQFTGRAMAKGVEDTTFYVYAPLLALNEVGGEPDLEAEADTLASFHEKMRVRGLDTMNTTATHDTKRGEDARTRLLALSELPAAFERRLHEWGRINHPKKKHAGGRLSPSRAEESMIYQTLLGAWPLDGGPDDEFRERINHWVEKSLREAKTNTSWIEIDAEYEAAVREWVGEVLDDEIFVRSFADFQARVAWYGWIYSLGQTLIRCTAPGAPDLYQGTESWDLSLVDPDNRRPVDFELRRRWLEEMSECPAPAEQDEWLRSWADGRVKMHVLRTALRARSGSNGAALASGGYRPLETSGALSSSIVAFSRSRDDQFVLTIASRHLTRVVKPGELPLAGVWGDTRIEIPPGAPRRWREMLSGETIEADDEGAGIASLPVSRTISRWPVALLVPESSHES